MEQPRILIVDDEQDLCTLIQRALEKEGFHEIRTAHTLKDGFDVFETFRPHLAILDVMLPDGEGYQLCQQMRAQSNIPILFLSAKSEEVDKLLGLAIGGDDYITKPFSPKEVAFRVKAQLRRVSMMEAPVAETTTVGPFQMNEDETEVYVNGERLELTAKEVGLLACFLRNPNRILSKETLFTQVWGESFFGSDNTVMVHIRRLREKVEPNPSEPTYIKTVKGLGYRLTV
ncbi:response regulator transcription factor [Exiguobacterium profundum]|uniref:Two component transcriptional regulator, winged helix family n=1 Tax=Exiguobacterium sp. (strain ATCC BAA-1283 / AT1b) TaxID=360911 RepID=C4L703_EXISA|nr:MULTISPECIES: response regulator transcription factor [Exiguobacterium]ACQ70096.1 two component transcriptional regulator, winged helix family [Exiguobacterium sp. AT1b]MDX5980351.1 response regulator transcription factor [Exiguobacterium profundum]QUP87714.1 response regulator transcription factor [Exiguobacterium sp. PFWT01]